MVEILSLVALVLTGALAALMEARWRRARAYVHRQRIINVSDAVRLSIIESDLEAVMRFAASNDRTLQTTTRHFAKHLHDHGPYDDS